MNSIHFFSEEISFQLRNKKKLRNWIRTIVNENQYDLQSLNFIFTSDDYLLKINLQYLNHRAMTDIITFDQSSTNGTIEGDIFISIDRVKENAKDLKIPFSDELHRVMIHGVLHLLGHKDKSKSQKAEMRKIENHYLALRF